jgi:hypothetical protein
MRFGYDAPPDEMDRLRARYAGGGERSTQETTRDGSRSTARPPDLALAAWTVAALLGIVLGLGLAKHGQFWGEDPLHPAAFVGTGIIGLSITLSLVAAARCAPLAVKPGTRGRGAGVLVWLSLLLVLAVAWSALSIIWFAGWELPTSRMPGP